MEFDEEEAEAYDTIPPSIKAAINLDGSTRNTDQTIGFWINDTLTTAVAGVHYNMVTTGTTTTLVANADEAEIAFDIIPGCMTTTSTDKKIVFNINRPGDLVPTEDSVFTYTLLAPKVEFIDPSIVEKYHTDSTVANNAGNIDIAVELISPIANVDRTIAFEINSKSTAIDGDQYSIVTPSPITIPANQRKGVITINVLDGLTSINKDLTVIIELTDDANLGAGNEDKFTLTILAPEN